MKTKRITIAEYLRNPTPESYERMVEQMARALVRESAIQSNESPRYANYCARELWRNGMPDARSALCAIGITAPKKGTRKRHLTFGDFVCCPRLEDTAKHPLTGGTQ